MIDHLDHLALTTANEPACIDFCSRVLDMQLETFVGGTPPVERQAFKFGKQKINLYVKGPHTCAGGTGFVLYRQCSAGAGYGATACSQLADR